MRVLCTSIKTTQRDPGIHLSTNSSAGSTDDNEGNAFSIIREVLAYVSNFKTPPTPEVYEVWYRFVEGGNKAIRDQLTHAIHEAKFVSEKQLLDLRRQFLSSSESAEVSQSISQSLTAEVEGLCKVLATQKGVNSMYSNVISDSNELLQDTGTTLEQTRNCIETLLVQNQNMMAQIVSTDAKLQDSMAQVEGIKKTLEDLRSSVLVDPLTGVGNRRAFDSKIQDSILAKDKDAPEYLFLLDLDDFKIINDTHGHSTGDDVLRFIGTTLKKLTGEAIVTRYGGDEFAVFMSVAPDKAKHLAEEICQHFFESDLTVRNSDLPLGKLTVSVGAAVLRADDDAECWFGRADKLLYNAKSAGRNRAMVERKYDLQ